LCCGLVFVVWVWVFVLLGFWGWGIGCCFLGAVFGGVLAGGGAAEGGRGKTLRALSTRRLLGGSATKFPGGGRLGTTSVEKRFQPRGVKRAMRIPGEPSQTRGYLFSRNLQGSGGAKIAEAWTRVSTQSFFRRFTTEGGTGQEKSIEARNSIGGDAEGREGATRVIFKAKAGKDFTAGVKHCVCRTSPLSS